MLNGAIKFYNNNVRNEDKVNEGKIFEILHDYFYYLDASVEESEELAILTYERIKVQNHEQYMRDEMKFPPGLNQIVADYVGGDITDVWDNTGRRKYRSPRSSPRSSPRGSSRNNQRSSPRGSPAGKH